MQSMKQNINTPIDFTQMLVNFLLLASSLKYNLITKKVLVEQPPTAKLYLRLG